MQEGPNGFNLSGGGLLLACIPFFFKPDKYYIHSLITHTYPTSKYSPYKKAMSL